MDFITSSLADRFLAVWNHDNRRYFVIATPFWSDWWATWGWRLYRQAASDLDPGVVLVGWQDSAVDHSFALDQPDGIRE
jgi:hypothetical protein